jgi:adenine phosphoribosyltransferase
MTIDLKKALRTIPDFPKPGILFYDIATLLADGKAWQEAIRQMAERAAAHDPQYIAGIDARGFLFAGALAHHFKIGALMVRKKGKLPGETIEHSYTLEYGSGTLEAQSGIFPPGARIVLVDDLLATGGTLAAACLLLKKLGGDVKSAITFIELTGLGGRDLVDVPYEHILQFPA